MSNYMGKGQRAAYDERLNAVKGSVGYLPHRYRLTVYVVSVCEPIPKKF